MLLIAVESAIGIWQYEFDVAGLGLGLVVALLFAAVSLDRRLLNVSLTAFAVYASIHFVYQVLHFDEARTISVALLAEVLLAIALLAGTARLNRREKAERTLRRRNMLGEDPRISEIR